MGLRICLFSDLCPGGAYGVDSVHQWLWESYAEGGVYGVLLILHRQPGLD